MEAIHICQLCRDSFLQESWFLKTSPPPPTQSLHLDLWYKTNTSDSQPRRRSAVPSTLSDDWCPWCSLLSLCIDEKIDETTSAEFVVEIVNEDTFCVLAVKIFVDGNERHDFQQFAVYADPDNAASTAILTRPWAPSATSPAAFARLRQWVHDCEQNHTDCQSSSDTTRPARLVTVFPDQAGLLKIHTVAGNETPKYAALSYCWGKQQTFLLTQSTFQNLSHGFSPDDLALTFQDAVQVARQVGCQYLWIDALCIVQDSDDDKAVEIGKIKGIFSNAYFTISASCATSFDSGFLFPREDQQTKRTQFAVPFLCPGHDDQVIGTAHAVLWATNDDDDLSTDYIDRLPSHNRAWTLEERVLSQRLLLFTPSQTFFECFTARHVDGGMLEGYAAPALPERRLLRKITSSASRLRLYETWTFFLDYFSSRGLTSLRDRLLAIGGLAAALAPGLGSEYLAGLWRETLHYDLLWRLNEAPESFPIFESERLPGFVAPSWSWASVSGAVVAYSRVGSEGRVDEWARGQTPRKVGIGDAAILKAEATLRSEAQPFGQVTAGTIVMKTWLARVRTEVEDEVEGNTHWTAFIQTHRVIPTENMDLQDEDIEIEIARDTSEAIYLNDSSDELILLHVLVDEETNGDQVVCGLLVKPVVENVFRRVGVYETTRMEALEPFGEWRQVELV